MYIYNICGEGNRYSYSNRIQEKNARRRQGAHARLLQQCGHRPPGLCLHRRANPDTRLATKKHQKRIKFIYTTGRKGKNIQGTTRLGILASDVSIQILS